MKYFLIICFLIITPLSALPQAESEIEYLIKLRDKLLLERDIINDSIESLTQSINVSKIEAIRSKMDDAICETKVTNDADIRMESKYYAEQIATIRKGTTVKVFDYKGSYWLVGDGEIKGYTKAFNVQETPEMAEYIVLLEEERVKMKKMKEEQEQKEKEDERAALLEKMQKQVEKEEKQIAIDKVEREKRIDSYGPEIAKKIRFHQYWIGMTPDMARLSLGNPKDINRSVGSWGTHEQWVYDNMYLYFENGKLTSWQD